jgi:hypothetical protein
MPTWHTRRHQTSRRECAHNTRTNSLDRFQTILTKYLDTADASYSTVSLLAQAGTILQRTPTLLYLSCFEVIIITFGDPIHLQPVSVFEEGVAAEDIARRIHEILGVRVVCLGSAAVLLRPAACRARVTHTLSLTQTHTHTHTYTCTYTPQTKTRTHTHAL